MQDLTPGPVKVIVTGDKAVRRVGRYMDIEIMTLAEFLARQK